MWAGKHILTCPFDIYMLWCRQTWICRADSHHNNARSTAIARSSFSICQTIAYMLLWPKRQNHDIASGQHACTHTQTHTLSHKPASCSHMTNANSKYNALIFCCWTFFFVKAIITNVWENRFHYICVLLGRIPANLIVLFFQTTISYVLTAKRPYRFVII